MKFIFSVICLSVSAGIINSPLENLHYSSLALLKDVRSQLGFPNYTNHEKSMLINQSRSILNIHVKKTKYSKGSRDDPMVKLDNLEKSLNLTGDEFHMEMYSIYSGLRDVQQQYVFPAPFSCNKLLIPLEFTRIGDNESTYLYAVAQKFELYTKFGQGWLDQIKVGDVLQSVDGVLIQNLDLEYDELLDSSNRDALIARWIEKLTWRYSWNFNIRSLKYSPLPTRNHVTLGFRRGDSSFIQTLDYLVYSMNCQVLTDSNQQVRSREDISMYDPFDRVDFFEIKHRVFKHIWGSYGYISISNFLGDSQEVVPDLKKILSDEFATTKGLVIDVRNNPGGSIEFAQSLIQLFSLTEVTPIKMRVVDNSINQYLMTTDLVDDGPAWNHSFSGNHEKYSLTSPPVETPNRARINGFDRAYFSPVVVLTNARCFGACEVFVSLMQDLELAQIYGEDRKTGGGGSTVLNSNILSKYLPNHFSANMPGSQNLPIAWKQIVRVGKNDGAVIDELGITVDQVMRPQVFHENRRMELYSVFRINYLMRYGSPVYLSIDGSHYFDIPLNRSFALRGGSRGIDRVSISSNGRIITETSVSFLPFHRWKALLSFPTESSYQKILTISGLSKNGSVLVKANRALRFITSDRLLLKKWHYFWDWNYRFEWTWDFQLGKYVAIYNVSGKDSHGWKVIGDQVVIEESYVPGTVSMISLFINAKHVTNAIAVVSLESDIHPNDCIKFEIANSMESTKILQTYNGNVSHGSYDFDLAPFAGLDLEFRIIFKSDPNSQTSNFGGVKLDALKVLAS